MKKTTIIFVILFTFVLVSCSTNSAKLSETDDIKTNLSVNIQYGGMCEAGKYIYLIMEENDSQYVARMNPDGAELVEVSKRYPAVHSITADEKYVFFTTESDPIESSGIYCLPIDGGKERFLKKTYGYKILVYAGRIFWEDEDVGIMSMNPDGTDQKVLSNVGGRFFICNDGIYDIEEMKRTTSSLLEKRTNILRYDFNGENPVKVNKEPVGEVDALFWDDGSIYFLAPSDEDGTPMYDSFYKLNADGTTSVILERVGFYNQSYGTNAFCGISSGVVYYFDFDENDETSETMKLYRYEISSKELRVLTTENMVNPSAFLLKSARGKTIHNAGFSGMYILGNDVYYRPHRLP